MNSDQRLHEIDLLRGLACLAVVAFHYLSRGPRAGWMEGVFWPMTDAVARYGYLGVHLFFMISGFVILYSAQEATPRSFVASRAARLYPAFWIAATITASAIWLTGDTRFAISANDYLINLSMFAHWFKVPYVDGAYWSLACEIHFYIYVWLALRFRLLHRAEWLMVGWLLVSLINAVRPIWPLEFWLNARWAPFFIAGGTCFLIRQQGATVLRAGLLCAAYLLALWYAVDGSRSTFLQEDLCNPLVIALLISLFFALFTWQALYPLRDFRWRGAGILGALTYPMYVLHQNLGYILHAKLTALSGHPRLSLILVVSIILALSWLLYRKVEPFWGRRLRRWLS